jgi:hypothetical protein
MAGRVGQRDPGGAVGEPGSTKRLRALCRLLVPVDQEIEVDLLGAFLAGPLRRNMLANLLEGNLLPVTGTQRDPAVHVADGLPAGQRGVERGERHNVCRVEGDELQASCHSHAGHRAPPLRQ